MTLRTQEKNFYVIENDLPKKMINTKIKLISIYRKIRNRHQLFKSKKRDIIHKDIDKIIFYLNYKIIIIINSNLMV